MPFGWFKKAQKQASSAGTGQDGAHESMLRFAEEALKKWLTINVDPGEASRVRSYVIEDTRVCAEALPYRIYVYDLDDPAGQVNFELLRLRSDGPGDVFENKEITVGGRKLGVFMYRVYVAQKIHLDPEIRRREQQSRDTGVSVAANFHSELSSLASQMPVEPGASSHANSAQGVAVYIRTTFTSTKYDGYQAELLKFCEQLGWRKPTVYHDRAGGRTDEAELEQLAQAFGEMLSGKTSGTSPEHLGRRLAEMSNEEDEHDRDNLGRLISDINTGAVRVVVLHDLSQLGKNKMQAFGVLSAMMNKAEVHMPGVGRINDKTPVPSGDKADYF